MQVTTLPEVEASLRALEPETLRDMALQLAFNHERFCTLTSTEGDCAHVAQNETRDRIDRMTTADLASLLAPMAWLSMDLHRRIGD